MTSIIGVGGVVLAPMSHPLVAVKTWPPGITPGGHTNQLTDPAAQDTRSEGSDYWAALIRFQWLVLEPEVPGKVQLSTTSGLYITVRRKKKNGMSAKL